MKMTLLIAVIFVLGLLIACARKGKPESHEKLVRASLERLLSRPRGAFTIIEETMSGKFVQFAGSKEEPLLLDLPSPTLSSKEMEKAKSVFAELGYSGPETHQTQEYPGGPTAGEVTTFMVKFDQDVDKATELVLAILHRVYGFDENAKLKFKEE